MFVEVSTTLKAATRPQRLDTKMVTPNYNPASGSKGSTRTLKPRLVPNIFFTSCVVVGSIFAFTHFPLAAKLPDT